MVMVMVMVGGEWEKVLSVQGEGRDDGLLRFFIRSLPISFNPSHVSECVLQCSAWDSSRYSACLKT